MLAGNFAWRLFLFVLFALVAAPLEFNVKWFATWSIDGVAASDALRKTLSDGALFFYAVVMAVEALFRIEMHPERATRPALLVCKGCCYLVPIGFVAYLVRGVRSPLTEGWMTSQLYLAFGSLFLSTVVFGYLGKADKVLRETAVAKP